MLGTLLPVFSLAQTPARPEVDARIHYYLEKVSNHPRLYPAYAQLAQAYLEKARDTHDPTFLRKARENLRRSIDIQPNFQAFKIFTALCNFSHRFEEALVWGARAAEGSPNDTAVTAMLVEASLGLGRYAVAKKLLPPNGAAPLDFHAAFSQARWFASQDRVDQAVDAFLKAARFARADNDRELVACCRISAAGILLDAGKPDRARGHLVKASTLDPSNIELQIHKAELLEADGQISEALLLYAKVIAISNSAELHARAFALARRLGEDLRAQKHFMAAEEGFLKALQAGEIYTLGALARLYDAADVNHERALMLARTNLKYKRDARARETLASLRVKDHNATQR